MLQYRDKSAPGVHEFLSVHILSNQRKVTHKLSDAKLASASFRSAAECVFCEQRAKNDGNAAFPSAGTNHIFFPLWDLPLETGQIPTRRHFPYCEILKLMILLHPEKYMTKKMSWL